MKTNKEDLLSLWSAVRVDTVVANETHIANKVLEIVTNTLDRITYVKNKAI